jgi:hypothetical protein
VNARLSLNTSTTRKKKGTERKETLLSSFHEANIALIPKLEK